MPITDESLNTAIAIEEKLREIQHACQDWARKTLDIIKNATYKAQRKDEKEYLQERCNKLDDCLKKLDANILMLERRPSCALMGKVSSGKTQLLCTWLGEQGQLGQILKQMPTGANDTTACLVSISASSESPTCLKLKLNPTLHEYAPCNSNWKPEKTDWTMSNLKDNWDRLLRFPTADDEAYVVVKLDEGQFDVVPQEQADSHGACLGPLANFQMYNNEVKIALSRNDKACDGLFRELTLIDCPGADPQLHENQDPWAKFKHQKNNQVFSENIQDIDMLLLVAKCDGQGMRQGDQLREYVWNPWVKRCNRDDNEWPDMRGRFAVVVTHAGLLFDAARVERPVDTWVRTDTNGIGSLIQDCFLPPLGGIQHDQPSLWPLFIFVENSKFPDQYNIISDSRKEALNSMTCFFKDKGENQPVAACDTWPTAWKAIHNIAQNLWSSRGFQSESIQRPRVYRRMLEALLALADPADRGHRRLTETLQRWVTAGPLRAEYLKEAVAELENAHKILLKVSGQLTPRNNQEWNEENIRQAAKILLSQNRWTAESLGWRFCLGQRTQRLREQVQANGHFDMDDVIEAVLEDSTQRLPDLDEDAKETLKNASMELLKLDQPWKSIVKKRGHSFQTNSEFFIQITHYIQQRLVAIFDWLVEFGELENMEAIQSLERGETLASRLSRMLLAEQFNPLKELGLHKMQAAIKEFSYSAYQKEDNL